MPNWLTEAKARCAAATPGPWTRDGARGLPWTVETRDCMADDFAVVADCGNTEPRAPLDQAITNAKFIQRARTDLPRALELLERCEALLRSLDERVTMYGAADAVRSEAGAILRDLAAGPGGG